jgi:hypothetical protein
MLHWYGSTTAGLDYLEVAWIVLHWQWACVRTIML